MPPSITVPQFAAHEIITDAPTRAARLKWVLIIDSTLPAGLAANAAACIAASVGASVGGLIGPHGVDADDTIHPGLPWAGCTVLSATPEQLVLVRAAATSVTDSSLDDSAVSVYVTDMPASAQTNRVYDGYLNELAATPAPALNPLALSLLGDRKTVERLTKKLQLL